MYIIVPGRRIRGLFLRRLLTDVLADERRSMTVDELVRHCDALGVPWGRGRPSKIVSDALRWEVGRGRVGRVERGRYRFVGAPRTTLRRIRIDAEAIRRELATLDQRMEDPWSR